MMYNFQASGVHTFSPFVCRSLKVLVDVAKFWVSTATSWCIELQSFSHLYCRILGSLKDADSIGRLRNISNLVERGMQNDVISITSGQEINFRGNSKHSKVVVEAEWLEACLMSGKDKVDHQYLTSTGIVFVTVALCRSWSSKGRSVTFWGSCCWDLALSKVSNSLPWLEKAKVPILHEADWTW